VHRTLQESPYVFSRTLTAAGREDRVVVAVDQGEGVKIVPVLGVFPEGADLVDAYSGSPARVRDGAVTLTTAFGLVLLSTPAPTAAAARP
jgi:alpha-amylase